MTGVFLKNCYVLVLLLVVFAIVALPSRSNDTCRIISDNTKIIVFRFSWFKLVANCLIVRLHL